MDIRSFPYSTSFPNSVSTHSPSNPGNLSLGRCSIPLLEDDPYYVIHLPDNMRGGDQHNAEHPIQDADKRLASTKKTDDYSVNPCQFRTHCRKPSHSAVR